MTFGNYHSAGSIETVSLYKTELNYMHDNPTTVNGIYVAAY
jgi:hypothetical protein